MEATTRETILRLQQAARAARRAHDEAVSAIERLVSAEAGERCFDDWQRHMDDRDKIAHSPDDLLRFAVGDVVRA